MSKRLDENIGAVEYDGLIVNNVPVADVFSVTIRKETAATVLKRGTVLALSGSGTAVGGVAWLACAPSGCSPSSWRWAPWPW